MAGGRSELYLMGSDARPDVVGTAVNVGHLVVLAAEQPGVDGVIALVDTCHAARAVPDVKFLVAGVRGGCTRVSLLMASGADQQAYDLVFSRRLVDVLRQGLPGAGERAGVAAVKEALRLLVHGQDVVSLEHDGDHLAAEGLWLAHNARRAGGDRPGPGPLGADDLRRPPRAPAHPPGARPRGHGRRPRRADHERPGDSASPGRRHFRDHLPRRRGGAPQTPPAPAPGLAPVRPAGETRRHLRCTGGPPRPRRPAAAARRGQAVRRGGQGRAAGARGGGWRLGCGGDGAGRRVGDGTARRGRRRRGDRACPVRSGCSGVRGRCGAVCA
ncbi:hypothetical protein ACIQ6Y_16220 [Streptomyces sp. NPDC096205]|uniref:vWA-MoxR associated conflict system protein n=1 Tax=Streptomyces sp. NPDC096205 TaxID=3366081 RepID=UPI0037F27CBC